MPRDTLSRAATLLGAALISASLLGWQLTQSADDQQHDQGTDQPTAVSGSDDPVPESRERSPGKPDQRQAPVVRPRDGGEAGARQPVRPGRPTALRLPSLGVRAPVTPVSSTTGILTPPADFTTVGWWREGAATGSRRGTAILTGHTVHTGGGALDDLADMDRGDTVVVERPGPDLNYVVSSVRVYRKGRLATVAEDLFRQDVPGRLAIVTCADWNGSTYLSNVVVTAVDPRAVG